MSGTPMRTKNLGRLWLAYTELQGEFYMLQLISVDSRHLTPFCTAAQNYEIVLIFISPKDVGLLWYHQMLERIMGNYQLKVPYILRGENSFTYCFMPRCLGILTHNTLGCYLSKNTHLDETQKLVPKSVSVHGLKVLVCVSLISRMQLISF